MRAVESKLIEVSRRDTWTFCSGSDDDFEDEDEVETFRLTTDVERRRARPFLGANFSLAASAPPGSSWRNGDGGGSSTEVMVEARHAQKSDVFILARLYI